MDDETEVRVELLGYLVVPGVAAFLLGMLILIGWGIVAPPARELIGQVGPWALLLEVGLVECFMLFCYIREVE